MRLGEVVVKHNVVVATLCLISMVTVGFGLTRINTDVQLLKMFDSQATIIGDYKWLEQHLGKLVPMELVVRVEPKMMQSSESDGDQGVAKIMHKIPMVIGSAIEAKVDK